MISAVGRFPPGLLVYWRVWVDLRRSSVHPKLYVRGKVFWKNKSIKPALVKRNLSKEVAGQLQLELRPAVMWDKGEMEEVHFLEELKYEDQYKEVLIFAGNDLILHANKIAKN